MYGNDNFSKSYTYNKKKKCPLRRYMSRPTVKSLRKKNNSLKLNHVLKHIFQFFIIKIKAAYLTRQIKNK